MRCERGEFDFTDILPRLVVAYETGRLVPFIGAGMSRPSSVGWSTLIARLEENGVNKGAETGESTVSEDPDSSPSGLIRGASRAVRKLRASNRDAFQDALSKALFDSSELPPQMEALAKIWWPLVLTTNYDDFYVNAFGK